MSNEYVLSKVCYNFLDWQWVGDVAYILPRNKGKPTPLEVHEREIYPLEVHERETYPLEFMKGKPTPLEVHERETYPPRVHERETYPHERSA